MARAKTPFPVIDIDHQAFAREDHQVIVSNKARAGR
jgi:hypothetical protein